MHGDLSYYTPLACPLPFKLSKFLEKGKFSPKIFVPA